MASIQHTTPSRRCTPNWLQARGADGPDKLTEVKVYLDNTELGGTTTLHDITTQVVSWIRYYDGPSAQSRWGIGHGAGVIFVSTQLRDESSSAKRTP